MVVNYYYDFCARLKNALHHHKIYFDTYTNTYIWNILNDILIKKELIEKIVPIRENYYRIYFKLNSDYEPRLRKFHLFSKPSRFIYWKLDKIQKVSGSIDASHRTIVLSTVYGLLNVQDAAQLKCGGKVLFQLEFVI